MVGSRLGARILSEKLTTWYPCVVQPREMTSTSGLKNSVTLFSLTPPLASTNKLGNWLFNRRAASCSTYTVIQPVLLIYRGDWRPEWIEQKEGLPSQLGMVAVPKPQKSKLCLKMAYWCILCTVFSLHTSYAGNISSENYNLESWISMLNI